MRPESAGKPRGARPAPPCCPEDLACPLPVQGRQCRTEKRDGTMPAISFTSLRWVASRKGFVAVYGDHEGAVSADGSPCASARFRVPRGRLSCCAPAAGPIKPCLRQFPGNNADCAEICNLKPCRVTIEAGSVFLRISSTVYATEIVTCPS